jgi:hypothetical protein
MACLRSRRVALELTVRSSESGVQVKRRSANFPSVLSATGRLLTAAAAPAAIVATALATSSAGAATSSKKLMLYGVGAADQFGNNLDERARGVGCNPFGNNANMTAVTEASGNGPFAGDEALFTPTMLTGSDLKTKVAQAAFPCQYAFNKNGFCAASFEVSGGTLAGASSFNFNAAHFTLALTGGSGRYEGRTGVVGETPAANHSQRFMFVFS